MLCVVHADKLYLQSSRQLISHESLRAQRLHPQQPRCMSSSAHSVQNHALKCNLYVSSICFGAARWKKPNPADPTTQLGTAVLDYFGYRHERLWVWVAFAVAIGWIFLLTLLLLLAFSYLPCECSDDDHDLLSHP